ncbi:MAG: XdhC family protein [Oscillochloris sp.]|nr:XdhC family protein [Oscillochloris sp.]
MKELIDEIDAWLGRGEQVAVATVVRTMGSSPRIVGAKMIVASGGGMAGSVSGGCVEGAVVSTCEEVLSNGIARLLHFGVPDENAWDVGMACGGEIDILVEPLAQYGVISESIRSGRALALATLIAGGPVGAKLLVFPGGGVQGTLGDPALEQRVATDALALLARATTRVVEYPASGTTVLVESFTPPPTLFMVGGVHIAIALGALASVLGFRTVVIDARAAFASQERFPSADELLVAWPDEALAGRLDTRSCVAVLTHDPKLDDPALRVALASPARYIGALGSTKTHAKRLERLRTEGFSDEQLARIHGPIGLPIGAKTPEEIAVSILAQIINVQHST